MNIQSMYSCGTKVLTVLLYGAETWSLTSEVEKKLDACQQWCIAHLQRIAKAEVLRRTNHTQISTVLRGRRLRLFGHVARSDGKWDHTRALRTVISGLPSHWRRPPGWPRWTWMWTVEKDLSALSIGLNVTWRQLCSKRGCPRWWWWHTKYL